MKVRWPIISLFFVLCTWFAVETSFADQESVSAAVDTQKADVSAIHDKVVEVDDKVEKIKSDLSAIDFAGVGFGVGIALTLDSNADKDRVKSASLVNGIVRVDEEDNDKARIMLELHYLFKPHKSFAKLVAAGNWGHGPFIALQPGSDNLFDSVGGGWMIAFKRPDASKPTSNSFNLGVGYVVDPKVQVLGDGLEPNQPLPAGETEIRYKTEAEGAVLLLASFQF